MRKIVLAVGLTGGHIYPAKALAEELGDKEFRFLYAARSHSPLGDKLLAAEGLPVLFLDVEGFPRRFTDFIFRIIPFATRQWRAFWISWRALKDWRPDAVAGFGGYVSFPVILAARFLGIPILIFEPNARMGLANQALSCLADKSAIGLDAPGVSGRGIRVRPPLRRKLLEEAALSMEEAKRSLGLDPLLPCVLIFGGSQGSEKVNVAAVQAISSLIRRGICFSFFHVTGQRDFEKVRLGYGEIGPAGRVVPYWENMGAAYRAAGCCVSRSGAMTALELQYFKVPSLLVPFGASTESHQVENARCLERSGIARIIFEGEELAGRLESGLEELLKAPRGIERQNEGDSIPSLADVIRSLISP